MLFSINSSILLSIVWLLGNSVIVSADCSVNHKSINNKENDIIVFISECDDENTKMRAVESASIAVHVNNSQNNVANVVDFLKKEPKYNQKSDVSAVVQFLFSELPDLQAIWLKQNGWSMVTPFSAEYSPYQSVNKIYIEIANMSDTIVNQLLRAVKHFTINNTNIEPNELALTGLYLNLTQLHLRNCSLTSINFRRPDSVSSLSDLDLSYNNLSHLDFLQPLNLDKLHRLNVAHNKIVRIEGTTFQSSAKLIDLNLSNNLFHSFEFHNQNINIVMRNMASKCPDEPHGELPSDASFHWRELCIGLGIGMMTMIVIATPILLLRRKEHLPTRYSANPEVDIFLPSSQKTDSIVVIPRKNYRPKTNG